jgi:hypothetical protein
MNPKAIIGDREVEIVPPDDWTTRELAAAEKTLQMIFDGSSAGAAMALTMFISLKRVDPTKPDVLLADEVLDMKFSTLREATGDAVPPDDGGGTKSVDPAAPQTGGIQPSDQSE